MSHLCPVRCSQPVCPHIIVPGVGSSQISRDISRTIEDAADYGVRLDRTELEEGYSREMQRLRQGFVDAVALIDNGAPNSIVRDHIEQVLGPW